MGGEGVQDLLEEVCCIDSSTVDFPISRFPFFMSFYLSVSKIRDGGNERVSLEPKLAPKRQNLFFMQNFVNWLGKESLGRKARNKMFGT